MRYTCCPRYHSGVDQTVKRLPCVRGRGNNLCRRTGTICFKIGDKLLEGCIWLFSAVVAIGERGKS
ncbi:hypothetical protein HanXRQr2_Chr15g0704671 [Helianthus annuus]|uniref:Uncharacterized protein n=1 Tax=Helianthus annuus TaxID=4232 RepID=A0A9K3E3R2_HELAN|nr:hypothetical protein HanXRQr2_Chr15g0704671 [Helianthus annuus]KAJ0832223.1 hypothetical protein HanPSC8_Chr15g0676271 [Helianthus annuus]